MRVLRAKKLPLRLCTIILAFAVVLHGCHSEKSSTGPSIEFIKIPPAAQGGRERVDTIAGRVKSARPGQQIVIYAHSGPWWVQPWHDLALALSALGRELGSGDTSQHSPQFLVEVEGAARELDVNLRDEVYRIAGEALRNALRHAQARRIELEIHYDEGQLRLRIRDDGKGMETQVVDGASRPGHWGLRGMRERAKVIGGNLELWSNFESGTEVELTIPASTAYGAAAFLVFQQACGDTRVIREPGGSVVLWKRNGTKL